jgi:hypothetical protein
LESGNPESMKLHRLYYVGKDRYWWTQQTLPAPAAFPVLWQNNPLPRSGQVKTRKAQHEQIWSAMPH